MKVTSKISSPKETVCCVKFDFSLIVSLSTIVVCIDVT